MNTVNPWVRFLLISGYIVMLVGAIDPMEGSLLILPGSGLVALGTYLADEERKIFIYRLWVFFLIVIGVAALFGFSLLGGIGSTTAYSMWWGLLMVPYPIGWSMGIWGPGSPRWVLWAGIVVGIWYLVILGMILNYSAEMDESNSAGFFLAAIGILTISGCIYRLRKRTIA